MAVLGLILQERLEAVVTYIYGLNGLSRLAVPAGAPVLVVDMQDSVLVSRRESGERHDVSGSGRALKVIIESFSISWKSYSP